jgi:MscS family membrane protein
MQDLTWWQAVGLLLSAVAAGFGGRLLGLMLHRLLYRRLLLSSAMRDDRFVLRLGEPLEVMGVVIVWQVLVTMFGLPNDVLAFCRGIGHIGLLLAVAWAGARGIDVLFERFAPRWVTEQRSARALLPLARRIGKAAIVVVIGLMALARMGFAIGPLLVLFAIVGAALALAAVRPLENVLAAYAIMSDHGIREGDTVRLEGNVSGTIESIGLYSTRIRTADTSFVIVPNRRLADAQIERTLARMATKPLGRVSHSPTGPFQPTTTGGLS